MAAMLCELVRFPSVEGPPEMDGAMPFGKAIDDCLRYTLEKSKEFGLTPEYVDGYAGHADIGEGDKTIGILVHLDVVPAGDGWAGDPFEPVIKDGRLYGRGANDNKAAVVTTLFALKALQELGTEFTKRVRVIFGCDEESGWADIAYYKTKHRMPDFGYSPDAGFPVINAEKGILHLELMIPGGGDDDKLLALSGGERANVVLAGVEAGLPLDVPLDLTGFDISRREEGDRQILISKGKAAHGAKPELGINAGVRLMQMLRKSGLSGNAIDLICECIGDNTDGAGFGVDFADEESGKLSLNLGILERKGGAIRAVLDIRYPVTVSRETVLSAIEEKAAKYSATVKPLSQQRALYLPKEHFLVKTLLSEYEKATGLPGYTIAIGGGTYARALDNAVAFGGDFPDSDDTDTAHQPNEFVTIDNLVRACKVYAGAIAALLRLEV